MPLPLLLLASLAAGAAAELPFVEVRGNLVLDEQVYRAVLDLPEACGANPATAAAIDEQLTTFLHRAGYELARVKVELGDGSLKVTIDEGRLARIVIRGRGTLTTLQLRLALQLPHQVFNRPALERQLRALAARYRLAGVDYALRPAVELAHRGPQVEFLTIAGRPLPLGGHTELWVTLPRPDWYPGLRAVLTLEAVAALAGLGLRDSDLLWRGDRFELELVAGARLLGGDNAGGAPAAFHRAQLVARYSTPPFWGSGFRPAAAFRARMLRAVRPDLEIDHYWFDELEGRLELGYELGEGLEASLGVGLVERELFDPTSRTRSPAPVATFTELRPFVAAEIDLTFDPWAERRDRQHRLRLRGRQLLAAEPALGTVDLDYRKIWTHGWHDLGLRLNGAANLGRWTVADELHLSGRFLRGVFGEQVYAEQILALGLDLRYSLSRDLFKVGVFHDLGLWRPTSASRPHGGNAFGPSLHALLLDVVQLDLYLALGLLTNGELDYGAAVSLSKAY